MEEKVRRVFKGETCHHSNSLRSRVRTVNVIYFGFVIVVDVIVVSYISYYSIINTPLFKDIDSCMQYKKSHQVRPQSRSSGA